jgi:hypothetical protein
LKLYTAKGHNNYSIYAPLILKMLDIIIKCGIRDGEIVDGEIEEGGCEETFLCLSLT